MAADPLPTVLRLVKETLSHEPGNRRAFLEEACGDDPALLDQVERLLGADYQKAGLVKEDLR